MALAGFRKSCLMPKGGIEAVALIEAKELVTAEYDAAERRYTSVRLRAGSAGFVRYQFAEDQAEYREQVAGSNGQFSVRHELQFALKGMSDAARQAVEELAGASCGLVAMVEIRQGETLLVGWSEKFGAEQALRLGGATGTTRSAPGEQPSETIVLTASDTGKAKTFAGEFPLKS